MRMAWLRGRRKMIVHLVFVNVLTLSWCNYVGTFSLLRTVLPAVRLRGGSGKTQTADPTSLSGDVITDQFQRADLRPQTYVRISSDAQHPERIHTEETFSNTAYGSFGDANSPMAPTEWSDGAVWEDQPKLEATYSFLETTKTVLVRRLRYDMSCEELLNFFNATGTVVAAQISAANPHYETRSALISFKCREDALWAIGFNGSAPEFNYEEDLHVLLQENTTIFLKEQEALGWYFLGRRRYTLHPDDRVQLGPISKRWDWEADTDSNDLGAPREGDYRGRRPMSYGFRSRGLWTGRRANDYRGGFRPRYPDSRMQPSRGWTERRGSYGPLRGRGMFRARGSAQFGAHHSYHDYNAQFQNTNGESHTIDNALQQHPAQSRQDEAAASGVSDWEPVLSRSTQKYYWFNRVTGETRWDQPPELTPQGSPTLRSLSQPNAPYVDAASMQPQQYYQSHPYPESSGHLQAPLYSEDDAAHSHQFQYNAVSQYAETLPSTTSQGANVGGGYFHPATDPTWDGTEQEAPTVTSPNKRPYEPGPDDPPPAQNWPVTKWQRS